MTEEVKAKIDRQRLIRAVVRREPEVILRAAEGCMVYCWVPSKKLDGEDNPPVAVTDHWDPHDIWAGVELPEGGTVLPILLDEGTVLYGISKGESHMMMSVVPLRYLGLFTGGS